MWDTPPHPPEWEEVYLYTRFSLSGLYNTRPLWIVSHTFFCGLLIQQPYVSRKALTNFVRTLYINEFTAKIYSNAKNPRGLVSWTIKHTLYLLFAYSRKTVGKFTYITSWRKNEETVVPKLIFQGQPKDKNSHNIILEIIVHNIKVLQIFFLKLILNLHLISKCS